MIRSVIAKHHDKRVSPAHRIGFQKCGHCNVVLELTKPFSGLISCWPHKQTNSETR